MDDSEKKQLGVSYWGIGASHIALLTLILTQCSYLKGKSVGHKKYNRITQLTVRSNYLMSHLLIRNVQSICKIPKK